MNRTLDVELVLRDYLADDAVTAPDHVLDVVEDRISRQRQRRSWRLLWRHPMRTPVKLAAGLAAALVIAVVGWTMLPVAPSSVGGPPASASPGPAVTPSLSPTASPPAYAWPTSLAAGTYTTSLAWDVPFAVQFTVPDGWSGYDIEISKAGRPSLSVEFVLVDNLFADPCRGTLREPPPGPSVDALAEALTSVPGLDVTGPTPVEFDRVTRGQYLEYVVREDAGCSPLSFALWDLSTERFIPGKPTGGSRPKNAVTSEGRIWILDVDGERLVIRATLDVDPTRERRAELQAIVDSIAIVRPNASPPPQPAP